MAKFVLFDFFAENTVEIGQTNWIEDVCIDECYNDRWPDFSREVVVLWPGSKKGAAPTRCVARAVTFSGS